MPNGVTEYTTHVPKDANKRFVSVNFGRNAGEQESFKTVLFGLERVQGFQSPLLLLLK